MTDAAHTEPSLTLQMLGALAFAGDLSMGQPSDHSPVTAILAARLARQTGSDDQTEVVAARLAMIRWAGCTANAREFAELFGDDVRGRSELISGRNPFVAKNPPATSVHGLIAPLAEAHCEVAIEIARRIGIDGDLEPAIDDLFENWDGSGLPGRARGEAIHPAAQLVAFCSDVEVYARLYGAARAVVLVQARGGHIYDPQLATRYAETVVGWITAIRRGEINSEALASCQLASTRTLSSLSAACDLLGDYVDLKRPDRLGAARLAKRSATEICARLGLDSDATECTATAAQLSGLGFVAIPNTALSDSRHVDSEGLRLAPHWTERILSRAPVLAREARLASMAFERLDGTGYHRGLNAAAIPLGARIVQVAVAKADWLARATATRAQWDGSTLDETKFDAEVVNASVAVRSDDDRDPPQPELRATTLTERERAVLAVLARGATNKEIARALDLSPKTISTHLESVYAKLGVRTRAAAAIKALHQGLIA